MTAFRLATSFAASCTVGRSAVETNTALAREFEQEKAVLLGGQPCVEQHRHHAGADRSPEQQRKVDAVEQNKGDAVFLLDPEPREHRPDAGSRVTQLPIGHVARGIDEGRLVAAPFGDMAVDEINRRVVVAGRSHGAEPRPARPCPARAPCAGTGRAGAEVAASASAVTTSLRRRTEPARRAASAPRHARPRTPR